MCKTISLLDKILTCHFCDVNNYYEIHSIDFSLHMVYINFIIKRKALKMARGRSSFKKGTEKPAKISKTPPDLLFLQKGGVYVLSG